MTDSISVWIDENYGNLLEITQKLSGKSDPDVLHYALESFLTKKNCSDIVESGGAKFYIITILVRALRSGTNPYYKGEHLYTSLDFDVEEEKYVEPFAGLTDSVVYKYIEDLFWYDKEVFLLYMSGKYTYKSLSEETGISRTSLNYTVNRVKDYLKKKIQDEINSRN